MAEAMGTMHPMDYEESDMADHIRAAARPHRSRRAPGSDRYSQRLARDYVFSNSELERILNILSSF